MLDYTTHKRRQHRRNTLSQRFSDVTACSSSTPVSGFKFSKTTTSSRHAQDRYMQARAAGAVAAAAIWWARTLIAEQLCVCLP